MAENNLEEVKMGMNNAEVIELRNDRKHTLGLGTSGTDSRVGDNEIKKILLENAKIPFGLKDKIGYAAGDFANDLTFVIAAMFMMKFYTDIMGVSSAIVGLVMMVAKIVDAFTDVGMGQIVDRSHYTKKGKFAPWIMRFAGPVAVASFLIFAPYFADKPMSFKIGWMFFTYILWGSVCYTGANIPYGSMASAITSDPNERQQLSTWRNIGATIAQIIIAAASSVFGAAMLFIMFAIHTKNPLVYFVLGAGGYVGIGIFGLVCWAMIIDVIDDIDVKKNYRSDGTVYAVYSFARKLGQAGASGLTGLLLALAGYTTATSFDTVVVNNIYNLATLVPAIGMVLLALSLLFFYPLSKKRVDKNAEILKQRREKQG